MKAIKQIKFYRKNNYGVMMEYVHPESKGDAEIIRRLTGQKTINSVVRELIHDLSGGAVGFVETVQP